MIIIMIYKLEKLKVEFAIFSVIKLLPERARNRIWQINYLEIWTKITFCVSM